MDHYTSNRFTEALAQMFGGKSRRDTLPAVVTGRSANGDTMVRMLGADSDVPVSASTASAREGDVVSVSIGGGSASMVGNWSNPSAGRSEVDAASRAASDASRTASNASRAAETASKVAGEAAEVAEAVNQHFWSDTDGIHVTEQTKEEWREESDGSNILINSLGVLLRAALKNLVSITRSATAFFDGEGNAAGNVTASFGADGAQVGKSGESHMELDYHSMKMVDKEGSTYFHVSDMRDADGCVTYKYIGDGQNTEFEVASIPQSVVSVTVDGVATTAYTRDRTTFTFTTAPANLAEVLIKYRPRSSEEMYYKAYTLGTRGTDGNIGMFSTTEGYWTTANGPTTHAEGTESSAGPGEAAHAEGLYTSASAEGSHAEGYLANAAEKYSHAEGYHSQALGISSHAEGDNCIAGGDYSHAGGKESAAGFDYSFVHGENVGVERDHGTAFGFHNASTGNSLFAIGNGTASNPSNAFNVDADGTTTAAGNVTVANHSSPIGSVLSNTKNSITRSGTAIDTMTNGASVTLTAGVWMVCGYWAFNTNSSGGARNAQVAIGTSGATDYYERVRVKAHDSSWMTLECSGIVNTSSNVTVYVKGSAGVANASGYLDSSHIKAVRIV